MLKLRRERIFEKYKLAFAILFLTTALPALAITNQIKTQDPIQVAKRIGDKLIEDTPFAYCLDICVDQPNFDGLQMIDFGRNFSIADKGIAYAFTQLKASSDMEMEVQIGHNDECSVWLNGEVVYDSRGKKELAFEYEERSIEFPNHFRLHLQKGLNSFLIKSISYRTNWRVYMQPPSNKGAVLAETQKYPEIGLKDFDRVDKSVSGISNWLIVGPFSNSIDLSQILKDQKPVFGQMFEGLEGLTTWTIPRIDVVGDFINPLPWGTNYHWNYHNGGVAWAMKILGETTNEKKYEDYTTNFCDFQLDGIPFLEYEMETLGKKNVPNGLLLNTPLLDFTLAPSLPLIYKLRKDSDFKNRNDYKQFVDKMLDYSRYQQIRLPGATNYTRTTPERFTTWVDDMFMGIPFLVQAALYADNEEDRNFYFNDAANQVLDFNKEVWDNEANLYVHAKYSNSNEKMVHWSRANGWGIWATTEVLTNLPRNHKKYKSILKHYRTHVESLLAYQHDSGFWHNVLDYPESREEVSGTAIFTMAIARGVTEGWLKGKKFELAAEKGWEAICSQIEEDGTVNRICYGTMCSSDVNYYLNRPFYKNDTHGLFAVLFAAIEMNRMLSETTN